MPLFKPHGSVDYIGIGIVVNDVTYPLRHAAVLNDCPIRRLPVARIDGARVEAYVVLPGEATRYANFQWIKAGVSSWATAAKTMTHCVFVGLSYWPCDRPEIDALIDATPSDATIIHANRSVVDAFRDKVESSGRAYLEWLEGPQMIKG